MAAQNNELDNKRKKAEKILTELQETYDKERKEFDTFEKLIRHRGQKELRIRTRIPVTISPSVKKSLKQIKIAEERSKINLIVDFKEPNTKKGRIKISQQKRKGKKKIVTIRAPESPSSISSPTSTRGEPPNKDVLLERLKRQKIIKKRMKSRK